jgi:hypothetical protein
MSQNQMIWKNVRNFHPLGMLEMNKRRSLKISTSQKEKKPNIQHNPSALNTTH